MPARKSSVKSSPINEALPTEDVLSALRRMQPIKNRLLATIIRVLSWLLLTLGLLYLFPANIFRAGGPQIFGTGVIVTALVLFTFQILMARVPETLETLWRRKLISARSNPFKEEPSLNVEQNVGPQENAERYLAYVNEFERLLNSKRGQLGMIITFEVFVSLWLGGLNLHFLNRLIQGNLSPIWLGELVFDMALAALIAPMAWRLIVIGRQIWQLPFKFDLKVQFEHPNQCGGLEPLTNLCFWNIFVISVPQIFFFGWLLIALSNTSGFSFYETSLWHSINTQAKAYANVYLQLLYLSVPFTIMGFVLPLWNTHRVMAEKRKEKLRRLDEQIGNITNEWNATTEKLGNLSVAEGNEKLGQLEFAKQIYQRQKHIPVWPINLNIVIKFASIQAVQILSLITLVTNFGEEISKLLSLIR